MPARRPDRQYGPRTRLRRAQDDWDDDRDVSALVKVVDTVTLEDITSAWDTDDLTVEVAEIAYHRKGHNPCPTPTLPA